MAPLPSNNTNIMFLDYNTCGEDHTLQVRYSGDGSLEGAQNVADAVLTAMGGALRLITVLGARVQLKDENFSLPTAWGGSSTYGGSAGAHNESAYYADFIGRTSHGRRVRLAVFGLAVPADSSNQDFRLTSADSGAVSDAVDVLNAAGENAVGIDDFAAIWYPYANIGTNAYWRNKIR